MSRVLYHFCTSKGIPGSRARRALFGIRPAHSLPVPDRLLVALHCAVRWVAGSSRRAGARCAKRGLRDTAPHWSSISSRTRPAVPQPSWRSRAPRDRALSACSIFRSWHALSLGLRPARPATASTPPDRTVQAAAPGEITGCRWTRAPRYLTLAHALLEQLRGFHPAAVPVPQKSPPHTRCVTHRSKLSYL